MTRSVEELGALFESRRRHIAVPELRHESERSRAELVATVDRLREQISDTADLNKRAGAVSQSLREASDTLKAELSDTGAEAIFRVRQAGMDAADAAREKAKSP